METENVLELKNIVKLYPGVRALDNVSIQFKRGEIHALAGENGAGKSTIIKTITGAVSPSQGEIAYEGIGYKRMTPALTSKLGISAIYQEFMLFNNLTVAENIFFGREPIKNGFVDIKKMQIDSLELFKKINIKIDPKKLVRELGVAYQQIVEIAKAISKRIKVLIMDEPTAPLSINEIEALFSIVNTLKAQGVTIIYISHRLDEIFKICDRVSILRDGQYITTKDVSQTSRKELISLMVGRELKETYPDIATPIGEAILEVSDFKNKKLKDVSFKLLKGEILGIGGLVGAGRTELVRALFGADKIKSGTVKLDGRLVRIKKPYDAIKNGIALIPEDRKLQGLLMQMSVQENISFASMKRFCRFCFINFKSEKDNALYLKNSLNIKTPYLKQTVRNLSGGNQQKVVVAKVLATQCDVLIFDEPTRGVDVGAKKEIYNIMEELIQQGKSIIMISSEMPELIGMSHRIIIMKNGRIMGELNKNEFSQESILELAASESN